MLFGKVVLWDARSTVADSSVPIVKILFAVTLAGMMVSTAVHAGCMQDRWGHVVCGAGSCVRDREGMVYCAPTRFGSVVRTIDGQVKCAHGQCVKTLEGELICSSVDGGGAVKRVDGTVRCEGSCEYATTDLCEALPAGR